MGRGGRVRASPISRAALARSNALVRGAFWAVACTATLALLIEHAIIHATVYAAEPAGWATVVGLAGAAVAAVIVSPAAAFTISLVYEHLEHAATAESTPAPSSHAPAQHR